MDEEKKSELRWEEAERLGPYQLHEQVPQSADGRGELYRATHEESGATALVLKPTGNGSAPLPDLRVRFSSSASPGFVAVEVEHTPWSVAPDKQSVESLVFTFEGMREGVRRMAQALSGAPEPRPRWRLGLALAGAAVVGALAFILVRLAPVSPPPGDPDPLVGAAPAFMNPEVPTDTEMPPTGISFRGITDGGTAVVAHPFPRKPYKGQKRPPCTPRIEVEIMGGCWVPHELKAPCPKELYEYQGKCYTVAVTSQPLPQSLGP